MTATKRRIALDIVATDAFKRLPHCIAAEGLAREGGGKC